MFARLMAVITIILVIFIVLQTYKVFLILENNCCLHFTMLFVLLR